MKKIKELRNLITILLSVLFTNLSLAQKIELESLNIMNSDLRVSGGNLIIKENATITLNSKINITGGSKDEYKVRIGSFASLGFCNRYAEFANLPECAVGFLFLLFILFTDVIC